MRIPIVYATTEGQTLKVAEFVQEKLAAAGHSPALLKASTAAAVDLAGVDGVILAGSVHAGNYQRALVRFAHRNNGLLGHMKTLFLSVSLTAAGHDPNGLSELDDYVARFTDEAEWTPGRIEHVAGALRFSEYDFFKAWIMRRIAADRGETVGRHEDREYTDWSGLEAAVLDWASGL